MNDVTPALIDGKPITTSASAEVRSPYDGSLIDSVPVCGFGGDRPCSRRCDRPTQVWRAPGP